jgi:hypothetical protein
MIMLSRDTDLSTSDLRTPLKFFSTTISKELTKKIGRKNERMVEGTINMNSSIEKTCWLLFDNTFVAIIASKMEGWLINDADSDVSHGGAKSGRETRCSLWLAAAGLPTHHYKCHPKCRNLGRWREENHEDMVSIFSQLKVIRKINFGKVLVTWCKDRCLRQEAHYVCHF